MKIVNCLLENKKMKRRMNTLESENIRLKGIIESELLKEFLSFVQNKENENTYKEENKMLRTKIKDLKQQLKEKAK